MCEKTAIIFLLSVMVSVTADIDIPLVGHWTFENGQKLKDLTGHFGDVMLRGATIDNGHLDVGVRWWAVAGDYKGPTITEKTLVSWLSIDNLSVQRGSVLTIDKVSVDEFDAIVLGEYKRNYWMAGSSFGRRSKDVKPGFKEKTTNTLIQLAISYENYNGKAHVRLYRNGIMFGDYTKGNIASWPKGDAEIFWGVRHGNARSGGPENMDAHIEESRIYAGVLTGEQLKRLNPVKSKVRGNQDE